MLVTKFEGSKLLKLYVPNYYYSEEVRIDKQDPVPFNDSTLICPKVHFELPDGKWFGMDNGIIEKFDIDREWDWRILKARKKIDSMMEDPEIISDGFKQLQILESSSTLCGIDLPEFVQMLQQSATDGEDLETTFNRIKDEHDKIYNDASKRNESK